MTAQKAAGGLALLREPFPEHQISKLPKQMRKDDQDKGKCERGTKYSGDGNFCGGWHARSIHLDYVGHAALTDRLLDADPEWVWEPVAFGPDGLPVLDKVGGLWIRLTVCGVTRLGYGDAQGKTGPNAVKEAIGDALRNAAMRFGAALDLWHKGGDLHADVEPEPLAASPAADPTDVLVVQRFEELIDGATTSEELQGIASEIASSPVAGADREALRRRFADRVKAVAA
jgi:hypothetical protein